MLFHSFFMGISTVYFETAASALFLAKFDASMLPYVYLGAAFVAILTGVIYSRIKEHLSFSNLMISTLIFLLIFVGAFRLGLYFTDVAWLVFGLLIWYRILSILTDLEYWAVAARLFDVRQSKRLFSLIGSGEVVARISGSFSVPLVVGLVGVPNLILISAIGLAFCVVFLVAILRLFANEMSTQDEGTETKKKISGWKQFTRLVGNRYLALIFVLSVCGVLGKYFVDFAFLEQMQTRYTDVENLAAFFWNFFRRFPSCQPCHAHLFVGASHQPFRHKSRINDSASNSPCLHPLDRCDWTRV